MQTDHEWLTDANRRNVLNDTGIAGSDTVGSYTKIFNWFPRDNFLWPIACDIVGTGPQACERRVCDAQWSVIKDAWSVEVYEVMPREWATMCRANLGEPPKKSCGPSKPTADSQPDQLSVKTANGQVVLAKRKAKQEQEWSPKTSLAARNSVKARGVWGHASGQVVEPKNSYTLISVRPKAAQWASYTRSLHLLRRYLELCEMYLPSHCCLHCLYTCATRSFNHPCCFVPCSTKHLIASHAEPWFAHYRLTIGHVRPLPTRRIDRAHSPRGVTDLSEQGSSSWYVMGKGQAALVTYPGSLGFLLIQFRVMSKHNLVKIGVS